MHQLLQFKLDPMIYKVINANPYKFITDNQMFIQFKTQLKRVHDKFIHLVYISMKTC